MTNYVCEVHGLTKFYGDFKAVDGVSFCVREGEIFGFLGPNGAGKTTTVRMLTGLTRISGGTARIFGYDVVRDGRKVKRLIGLVPDTSNLYSELTCWDNLIFHGEMYGVPRRLRAKRAEELLELFDLRRFRDVKFRNLSKGLKRRLTIAAALMHEPKLLFLDEPTLGLDVLSRRKVWGLIRKLNREGLTIFLTTHNIYEAFELCDRIAVINKGRIVAVGTPAELRSRFSATKVIEVSFSPSRGPLRELAVMDGIAGLEESGGRVKLIVQNPLTALEALTSYARRHGLSIELISLRGADAEEVFLNIIGGGSG